MESNVSPSASRVITARDMVVDKHLPAWARRSNPVVRRELGDRWKRLFPDVALIGQVFIIQAAALLLLPLDILMVVTLPIAVIAVVITPVAVFLYGRTVVQVVYHSVVAIVDARANHTLDLLRVSLLPREHIIMGKVAASLWNRIEDLDMILLGLMVGGMPIATLYYIAPAENNVTLGLRLIAALGMLALPARAVLEPFMLGALAVAVGTVVPTRAGAVVVVLGLAVFYYAISLVPLVFRPSPAGMLLGGVVLPLVVTVLATAGAILFAQWRIRQG